MQLDGRTPDGQRFYFRSRHEDVLLAIGGDDPVDGPAWEAGEQHPAASHLPAKDGHEVIRRLGNQYEEVVR